MFRSRVQLATTYAPGVLFTWEGAKGICRSVPIDRGEASVSDATRLLVFDGMKEIASSWLERGDMLRAPDNVPIELVLDDVFYDQQSRIVDRDWRRIFQLCDPGTMGYVPYPLVYRCAVCGHLREMNQSPIKRAIRFEQGAGIMRHGGRKWTLSTSIGLAI